MKIKKIITLIGLYVFTCCHFFAVAQNSFERADSIAASLDGSYGEVKELAQQLTGTLTSDEEKARAIYMWLAHHVRYDCRKYHKGRKGPTFSARTKEAAKAKQIEWQEKQNKRTIKVKSGICADYSRLFKALCDEAKVEAVVISGNSRDFHRPYRKAHKNPHAWNAVKFDDQWHLLDATWGAGYTDAAVKKFSRKVTTGYFCTPANWFAQNHFPNDEKWQLLEQPISKSDFSKQSIINYGQTKYRITAFAPQVIDLDGKNKEIWLTFENKPKVFLISTSKGKHIPVQATEKDGKVILSFSTSFSGSLTLFGGKSKRTRKGIEWLAKYDL